MGDSFCAVFLTWVDLSTECIFFVLCVVLGGKNKKMQNASSKKKKAGRPRLVEPALCPPRTPTNLPEVVARDSRLERGDRRLRELRQATNESSSSGSQGSRVGRVGRREHLRQVRQIRQALYAREQLSAAHTTSTPATATPPLPYVDEDCVWR